jgi:hypothetical protein
MPLVSPSLNYMAAEERYTDLELTLLGAMS